MNNIIKDVQEKYPEVHIDKESCPSYIKMYTKDNNQIILVYVEGQQKVSTKVKGKSDIKEDLDLTGSPLKVDLSLHSLLDDTFVYEIPKLWSKDEETHGPIDIKKAREICNYYNKIIKSNNHEKTFPFWILTNPTSPGKPLLLTLQSEREHFIRGIVTYEDMKTLNEINVYKLVKSFAEQEGIEENMVVTSIDCKYHISGTSHITVHEDDLINTAHSGLSELSCEWATMSLEPDLLSCKVNMIQEVIVGHVSSPCNALWASVCALQNLHQLIIDMNELGPFAVDLKTACVRNKTPGTTKPDNSKRLKNLLNETEEYAYATECPTGGCTAVTEDTTSLRQALFAMTNNGSSNDFTYKLWDILRDCETPEELINLLIETLKFFSSSNIHPFIDGSNKTFISQMILKLARGHSQAAKFIKNLHSNPLQALTLVTQLGVEKTMWEYTKVMSLLDHSYAITAIWNGEVRSSESIEQINQTIQEMSMSGGDFTMNPFESLVGSEMSIRIDCDSFYEDPEVNEDLANKKSIKNQAVVNDRKESNEVPLIADDIDISPWKNLLLKFAQVHVCLEHLYRAETNLRLDFSSLKPIASQLLDVYASNKSPVKSAANLIRVPLRSFSMPIANNDVLYHLKKPALWYRVAISRNQKAREVQTGRDSKLLYVLSQYPVFPPSVWQHLDTESQTGEVTTLDTVGIEIKYHCTKYAYLSTQLANQIKL